MYRCNVVVDELVRAKADPSAEENKEAGVPVNDDKNVDDEVDDADCVRKTALCLNTIKKLHTGTHSETYIKARTERRN